MSNQSLSRMGLALVMLAVLLWSANFIFIRATVDLVPPMAMSFYRWLVASTVAVALAAPHLRRDWPVLVKNWRIFLLLGSMGMTANTFFLFYGLQTTTAINALLMNSMLPLLTAVFAFLFFRERQKRNVLIGIVFAMAGVTWVITRGDWQLLANMHFNAGDFWILAGVASYAVYVVCLRKVPPLSDFSINAATFVLGAICLLPFFLWEYAEGARTDWSVSIVWIAILYTAIGASVIPFFCFNQSIRLLGPTRASSFLLLTPFFGAILAILFLGEKLTFAHVAGAGLIFTGLFIGRR